MTATGGGEKEGEYGRVFAASHPAQRDIMVIIGGAGVPASPTPSVQSAEQTPVPEPTPDDGGRKKRVPWTPGEDKLLADVVAALELEERGTTDW